MKFAVLILLFYTTSYVYAQNVNFICNAQTSCNECVTASPLCVWCSDPVGSGFTGSRCYSNEDTTVNCTEANLQDPRSGIEGASDDSFNQLNQIIPRSINVALRRGEPVTFNLSVQPAPNFPLDLYLLMDLSYSMEDDLANLKTLGNQIANTIESITSNFQLGFGAFVDKRLAPFVDTTPTRLNDPCNDDCEAPYSFKHIVSLSADSDNFNARVQEQIISGNIDSPEGGFDGLLQAIVCQDLIGWRENARKLLLYITDAGFHYAGDGKLSGTIVPHNGECLMGTQNGNTPLFYEEYDVFDFPSIGQIRQKLREFDIIPMFAATSGASPFYTTLASELEGGIVGTLASDSGNIINLIQESYNNVSQRVIILPDAVANIAINATPTFCPNVDEDGICEGLQIGKRADFNITISLLQCSEIGEQTLNVRVLGFGSFQIQITEICNCTCQGDRNESSPLCSNGNGALECGVCDCNEGRFGDVCQCDATGTIGGNMNTTCLNGPNGLLCSGRGVCVCGTCECQTFQNGNMFFGQVCECDNFQCDRDPGTGLTCGGPDRGVCSCDGQCECLNSPISGLQYTGSSCDCSPDNNTCIDISAGDNMVCSDNGECTCGECYCNNGYTGSFCEICTNITICPTASCNVNQQCAQCAFNLTTEGCENCTFTMVADNEATINGNTAVTCDFTDDNGCEYRYFVALDGDGNTEPVNVNNRRECPTRVAPWIYAVSIIGALLSLGIIALIAIKLILMLLDHIEVKKFLNEVQDPSFRKNENPLFQSPNKEYKNPVYGQ